MIIAARKKGRACRRAECIHVKAVVAQAALRQPLERGRVRLVRRERCWRQSPHRRSESARRSARQPAPWAARAKTAAAPRAPARSAKLGFAPLSWAWASCHQFKARAPLSSNPTCCEIFMSVSVFCLFGEMPRMCRSSRTRPPMARSSPFLSKSYAGVNNSAVYTRAGALRPSLAKALARPGPPFRTHSITRAGAPFVFNSFAMKRMCGSICRKKCLYPAQR